MPTQQPPAEVKAACLALAADPSCAHNQVDPQALLDFKIYPDRVTLILFTGQKYTVAWANMLAYLQAKPQKSRATARQKRLTTRK